jgi:hypothetical protein
MPKRRKAGFIGKREAKRLNRAYEDARARWRESHPPGPVEVTEGPVGRGYCDPMRWDASTAACDAPQDIGGGGDG